MLYKIVLQSIVLFITLKPTDTAKKVFCCQGFLNPLSSTVDHSPYTVESILMFTV